MQFGVISRIFISGAREVLLLWRDADGIFYSHWNTWNYITLCKWIVLKKFPETIIIYTRLSSSVNRKYIITSIYIIVSDVLLWTTTHGRAKQDNQHEHTFSNYVRIQDVVQKTCLRRWTIGKSGERGSGISVLPAQHDDDDEVSKVGDRNWGWPEGSFQ